MFCLNWKTASQKLDQNDKINAFVLIAWIFFFFFFRDEGLKNLDNEKLELKNRIKKKKRKVKAIRVEGIKTLKLIFVNYNGSSFFSLLFPPFSLWCTLRIFFFFFCKTSNLRFLFFSFITFFPAEWFLKKKPSNFNRIFQILRVIEWKLLFFIFIFFC